MKQLLLVFACIPFLGFAQVSFDQTPVSIEKAGTVYPAGHTTDWNVKLQKHKYPTPDGEDYWSELERRKDIQEQRFPRKYHGQRGGGTWSNDSLPRVIDGFEGNLAGNGTPNDNNLAISNSGYLISVVNSNVYFYDMNADTLMYNNSLGAWTLGLNITGNKFDPKVIYDPHNDRFVLVFLNGTGSLSSRYVVCFSTTDNPMDPWNMYKLNGNPFDDNSWSDYPALAITKDDLFLTINLLVPGQSWQLGFKQSIIWQIEKRSGYDGDSALNTNIWSNIAYNGTNIRNLHPVRNARGQFDNQNRCYFLSNKNFALESDSLFLVEVTDQLTSGIATMNIDLLQSQTSYFLTVNAPEPGGQELATNDSRILGGIWEGDTIQFVQNSIDTANGNSAVYHGFIDLTTMTCDGNVISDTTLNFGYANIAGTGNAPGSQESIITFEYSSENDYPGYAGIYYDGSGSYSPVKILKAGENKISVFNDPVERWGDYSGIQRDYTTPCQVWACGTYGKSNQDNGTWIARIGSDETCTTLPTGIADKEDAKIHLYPNPSYEMVNFEFNFSTADKVRFVLYDQTGKLVQVLMEDYVSNGEYQFSFNVSHLPAGHYVLHLEGTSNNYPASQFIVK